MFEGPLQDLIDELSRLPGVGPKSAQRIAFHLLHVDPIDITRLQAALGAVQQGVSFCRICHNISRDEVCRICADSGRDRSTICVVEEPKDIQVLERTGEFNGRYHVLGGALDPLNSIGPKELNITALLQRIGGVLQDRELADSTPEQPLFDTTPEITEVILATDPTLRGRPPRAIWRGCSRIFRGWWCLVSHPACHWAAIWSLWTSSPCRGRSAAD